MTVKTHDEAVLSALRKLGTAQKAALELNMSERQIQRRLKKLKELGFSVEKVTKKDVLHVPTLPDGKIDIRTLIDRRKETFEKKNEFHKARKLVPITVKSTKPIGITFFGDPHLDDDGTDLSAIERDMETIKNTDGLYAACIGDVQNNWIGRLAHLWAHQETTSSQAWQLVEWFVHELRDDWLFMVQGNHDHWSGNGDPLRWIQRQAGVSLTGDHTVRIALKFPNGQEVRIAARHDWPGNSMWNPSHGQLRAAHLTNHDHIIVSGHRHTGGYQMLRIPATGMLAHLIQLGAYKTHDAYADALGFPDKLISPSCTVIIDPLAGELGLVRIEHDTEVAADFLNFLRSRNV